jgi:PAS domain S-box-containing protein
VSVVPDFQSIFASLPVPLMVMDRDLRLVAANDLYLATTNSRAPEIVGKHVFDAFPDSLARKARFQEAFERAVAGEENVIAMLPFDVPRPGGGTETRYWSCTHTPIRDAGGNVTYIVQQAQDVTALIDPAHPAPRNAEAGVAALEGDVIRRAVRIEALSQALRGEAEYLKAMFRGAPNFMCVLSGSDFVFELANDAFLEMIGRADISGRPIGDLLPELEEQGLIDMLRRVVATGEAFRGREYPLVLSRGAGQVPRRSYVDFVWQPIFDEEGKVVAIFMQGSDVTDRVQATEQQRILLDEVNHRVKNTLTTVQAMVAQTLKTSSSPAAFAENLSARLMALSATHNLLTARNWSGAGLRELLLLELKPFGVDRVEIDGAEVMLSPRRATNMGLVFHELAINAAKYGALSAPSGRVSVRWAPEAPSPEARLVLDWIEQGGPKVSEPQHKGFGTRLIDRTIRAKPGASYRSQYLPEGLHWQVRLPPEGGKQ